MISKSSGPRSARALNPAARRAACERALGAPTTTSSASFEASPCAPRNEVLLCGRLAAAAEERQLPSGDVLATIRIIIDRDAAALATSAQRVDTIDCVVWAARVRRTVRAWAPGDRVQVEGAIRRRFFRGVTGPVSRVEVEIKAARRLRPAPT